MTEEEKKEYEFVKNNSPDALPLNTAESDYTAEQIRQFFVTPFYYLLELIQSSRQEFRGYKDLENTDVKRIEDKIRAIESGIETVTQNSIANVNFLSGIIQDLKNEVADLKEEIKKADIEEFKKLLDEYVKVANE